MTNTHQFQNQVQISDSDFINLDDYRLVDGRFYVIHDHGFTVAIVWADNLASALDEAADQGRLEPWHVSEGDPDYTSEDFESGRIDYLGNCGVPYDIEALSVFEFEAPSLSICALLGAAS